MARKDDFDWLDDPFDEKKPRRTNARRHVGGTSSRWAAVLIAVVGIVVLLGFVLVNMAEIMAS